MKRYSSATILSAVAASVFFASVSTVIALEPAASEKPLTKADVEEIVKQVINDNPELIIGSVEKYQLKRRAEEVSEASGNVVKLKNQLDNDKNSPAVGNPDGDVTIVEFFDYHCGYCKQFLPTVTGLLDDDHKLRLVFKEFPILSEDSGLAAKAALAVNKIDRKKYLTYHMILMRMSGAFTMRNLTDKAKEIGIDAADFKKAMGDPELDKEISENKELARSLNIHGTPAIVVGTEVIPGVIPMSDLKAKIAALRDKKAD